MTNLPPSGHDELSGPGSYASLRQRAKASVVVVLGRGAVIALIGLLSQLVLTRFLVAADFGAVAFGLAVVAFVNLFADGGLGGGLIRRTEPPEREELEALSALQVSVAAAGAVVIGLACVPTLGRVGWVTTVIVSSAPLLALQIPGRILLERELRFDRLARVELVQVLCFNMWAVLLVVLGSGVWGLATAPVVRAVVGALAMRMASPVGVPGLRFSWVRIRALMGFGVKFQAVTALWLVREQGLNMGIAAVSGVTAVGYVSLAKRLLEVPFLLLNALWRVSFPTMSRLVSRGEPVCQLLEHSVAVCASGLAVVLVGLGAAAPGIVPGLFGQIWSPAATVLPAACFGLGISGAISVACQGYLYAIDDAGSVMLAGGFQTVALFSVALSLLPVLGLRAVGVGWAISYLVEALLLGRAAARRSGASLLRPLFVPTAVGLAAGAVGWWLTVHLGRSLVSGVAGGSVAVALLVAVLAVLQRDVLVALWSFATSGARSALGRDEAAR